MPYPSNTNELIARYRIGSVTDVELIGWAEELLLLDHYSDSVPVLAGYHPQYAKSEREDFLSTFEQAVVDVGLEPPPLTEAYEKYGEYLCRGIIEGFIKPSVGHKELYEIWVSCAYKKDTPSSEMFAGFMYLDDSMGLLDEGYDPLLDRLKGLSVETYPHFLKEECRLFLTRHE